MSNPASLSKILALRLTVDFEIIIPKLFSKVPHLNLSSYSLVCSAHALVRLPTVSLKVEDAIGMTVS